MFGQNGRVLCCVLSSPPTSPYVEVAMRELFDEARVMEIVVFVTGNT